MMLVVTGRLSREARSTFCKTNCYFRQSLFKKNIVSLQDEKNKEY